MPYSKDHAHELSSKSPTSFVDVFTNFISYDIDVTSSVLEKQSEDSCATSYMAF